MVAGFDGVVEDVADDMMKVNPYFLLVRFRIPPLTSSFKILKPCLFQTSLLQFVHHFILVLLRDFGCRVISMYSGLFCFNLWVFVVPSRE